MKAKKLIICGVMAIVAMITYQSCSKSSTAAAPPAGNNIVVVSISGMAFPASTSIKVGQTITWVNKDGYDHTVTSNDDTTFSSGNVASQNSFSYKAIKAGTFPYHCAIHANMNGTLVVTQ